MAPNHQELKQLTVNEIPTFLVREIEAMAEVENRPGNHQILER
jgi:hypothetical protein